MGRTTTKGGKNKSENVLNNGREKIRVNERGCNKSRERDTQDRHVPKNFRSMLSYVIVLSRLT